jgi:hypothetical protein
MSSLRAVSRFVSPFHHQPRLTRVIKSSPLTHRSSSPTVAPSSNGVPSPPSNSQIEAVIQMATSNAASSEGRNPGRDTRTQLFVGNVSPKSLPYPPILGMKFSSHLSYPIECDGKISRISSARPAPVCAPMSPSVLITGAGAMAPCC